MVVNSRHSRNGRVCALQRLRNTLLCLRLFLRRACSRLAQARGQNVSPGTTCLELAQILICRLPTTCSHSSLGYSHTYRHPTLQLDFHCERRSRMTSISADSEWFSERGAVSGREGIAYGHPLRTKKLVWLQPHVQAPYIAIGLPLRTKKQNDFDFGR